MMLRSLVELADRLKLVERAGYVRRLVDFEIRIDRDGRFLALVSLRGEDGKGQRLLCPAAPKRASNVCPGFLVDNTKYVLGIGDGKKDKPARVEKCRQAFVNAVRDALSVCSDPALAAVVAFFDDFEANRLALLQDRPHGDEWTGGEIFAFSAEGLGFVHEQPDVQAFWSGGDRRAEAGDAARCLVTGKFAQVTRLHPSIKLPGGQTSGTSLVSFNAPAFESHGLQQGSNAPVSEEASAAYGAALHHLLERDPTSERPHRYGVRLGGGAVALYWTTAPLETLDFFADLWTSPRAEAAEGFFSAPWEGEPPPELDTERFYAVTVSPNAARLVVRHWFESTLGVVKESLHRYFDDLAIDGESRPLAIWQILAAIDPPGDAPVPPDLASRIFLASLRGSPLPREILRHALLRLRLPPDREKNATALLRARAAVIKATLRGIGRTDISRPHLKEITVSLDENNPQPAYVLGRLFAALERAQQNALGGDLDATIRDRYFAAASMTPATVFPRLIRLAQHHVSKARADGRDYGIEKTIGGIVDRLPATGFPALLPLEDQGLFAVGYYHQRQSFFASRKS